MQRPTSLLNGRFTRSVQYPSQVCTEVETPPQLRESEAASATFTDVGRFV